MKKDNFPDLSICKICVAGTCCYEGAELSKKELRCIITYNPKVAKPWFRLVKKNEEPEEGYPFTTIMRDGTCVFQGKDNLCAIYPVRPKNCREFPIEKGKEAPHYRRLCVVFADSWRNNTIRCSYRKREKK